MVDETGTSSATIGNSSYEEDENGTSSKKRVIIGFLVAFVVIAAIVFFSQKGASTDSNGGSIEQVDSVVPEVADTVAVESEEQKSSQSNTEARASKPANNGNKDKDASQEKTKDVKEDNASTLKSALARGNYKKVQQLANEGYSAAYGPLAKYYLQNNEYSLAETYARKAKAAGFSEGSSVLRTLESLGYYD